MEKEETARRKRQHGKMVGKIRREEKDEQDLAKLRRLHGKRAECEPVLIAADAYAEDQRQEQHKCRCNPEHIRIVEHASHALPKKNDNSPEHDADACPAQLCLKKIRFQPRNFSKPDGEEHVGKRERDAVQLAACCKHIACRPRTKEERKPRQVDKLHTPVKSPSRCTCSLFEEQNTERTKQNAHRRKLQSLRHDGS